MSMVVTKYRKLVERLYDRFDSAGMSWSCSSENNFVETKLAGNTIRMFRTKDEDETPLAVLCILGEDGALIERFTDEDIKDDDYEHDGKSYYQLMLSIIDSAKRRATGADVALDAILEELD